MRYDRATPELRPTPARPDCWQEIRDELFLALSNLGLNNEAASAAAERGADAAIVEARLVTPAEARRWGRPSTGAAVTDDTPEREAMAEVETDILEISTLATIADLAAAELDMTRPGHQSAALRLLGDLVTAVRRLSENWGAAARDSRAISRETVA